MQTIEKLGDYKRFLKGFVRGVIKAKVFATAENKVILNCCKCDEDHKVVTVTADNGTYTATFTAEVSTRIYNKFDDELFAPIAKQFGKLKNFGGLEVNF